MYIFLHIFVTLTSMRSFEWNQLNAKQNKEVHFFHNSPGTVLLKER